MERHRKRERKSKRDCIWGEKNRAFKSSADIAE